MVLVTKSTIPWKRTLHIPLVLVNHGSDRLAITIFPGYGPYPRLESLEIHYGFLGICPLLFHVCVSF